MPSPHGPSRAGRSEVRPVGNVPAGTVCAFQTLSLFDDAHRPTGRYGAYVVLGRSDQLVAVEALDGVWTSMPSLDDVRTCGVLRSSNPSTPGTSSVPEQVVGCRPEDVPAMPDLTEVGAIDLTPAQQERLAATLRLRPGTVLADTGAVSWAVEWAWRRSHDREALDEEARLYHERMEQELAAARHRYETRTKHLTWEQLLSETPFGRWQTSPAVPDAFREEAVARVHQACRDAQALGAKPRRPAMRKILKGLVEWFNQANRHAGGVIETQEREEIIDVLQEIAVVSRQHALVEEFHRWRDW